MTTSNLPDTILSAIKSGDLPQLRKQYDANVSLEEIARQAASSGQADIIEWCYTQGWAPKSPSFNDRFYICTIDGASPTVFQVLINHGWDINAHETETVGDALACAISTENYNFAKWLLDHGHRPTPIDSNYGNSSVSELIKEGSKSSFKILKLLLDYRIDLKDEGMVMVAANYGHLRFLESLLDYGVDTEDRAPQWYPFDGDEDNPYATEGTGLYRACRQGHLDCVRLLLDRGANAQAKDDSGTSCLAIAKERHHDDIVELLLHHGATID
ncbi:ankyrin repeat-containing domain protein [Phaeosphaeria sp. MPI-PUGE-AT-0046c]|nr:ankyrin repeat-containing domain protein [Phaeosphaeria sp. MPI-PUGE-AT-0046c]